ncbi:hypothetical protein [Deinococcus sp.]|uniref:hypothetical protein n=1 Tax=Deinococcus sp. TaxID=47478 RepID=UPI00391B8FAA
MPDFLWMIGLLIGSPLLAYLLTVRFRRRWLLRHSRWWAYLIVPAHLFACLTVPPVFLMWAEYLWDVRYGHCSTDPTFPQLCWGHLQTGVFLWYWMAGFLTVVLLGIRPVVYADADEAGG